MKYLFFSVIFIISCSSPQSIIFLKSKGFSAENNNRIEAVELRKMEELVIFGDSLLNQFQYRSAANAFNKADSIFRSYIQRRPSSELLKI